jgi:acetyltransferase-like isoleucine patch superfamily enzyme
MAKSAKQLVGSAVRKTIGAQKTQAVKTIIGYRSQPSNKRAKKSANTDYGENTVINHPKLENSKIVFKGKNNILYCESADTILNSARIKFEGDNAVVYLSKHANKDRRHKIRIYAKSNTTVYIGNDVNFHPGEGSLSYLWASEQKNIIIGNDCLFSVNTKFRTSDGHAAYDSNTKQRNNPAKSIFVGDHVWFGQDITALKGSRIGSGSIIGAGSIITGKTFASNTSCAGVPAREVKQGVFFARPNINGSTDEQLNEIATCDTDEWIYSYDNSTLSMDEIDKDLSAAKTSDEKLSYIKKNLAASPSKNRFYVGEENTQPKN